MKNILPCLLFVIALINIESGYAIDRDDMIKIADLHPTTYYTPSEVSISCKGRYRSSTYSGKETQALLTTGGKQIATVCKRFAMVLLMEGAAVLKDRGQGEVAVNFSKYVKGTPRYGLIKRCTFGQGTRPDLCLLPYHTIAADNQQNKINEIIYIPAANGIELPDGSIHDGMFIVRDTGGAFKGVGAQRVDLFVGTDPDDNNAFQKAGFSRTRSLKAYKVKGESAKRVRESLKEKFGELY